MLEKILAHKTVIFLIFIIVIVIISAILQMFSTNREEGKDRITPTPTGFLVQPSGTIPGEEFPPFTGERDIPVPTEYSYVNTAFDLRSKLPYSQSEFSISYDYKRFVFVVSIAAPFDKNKAIFDAWITANGYSAIPQDQFVVN